REEVVVGIGADPVGRGDVGALAGMQQDLVGGRGFDVDDRGEGVVVDEHGLVCAGTARGLPGGADGNRCTDAHDPLPRGARGAPADSTLSLAAPSRTRGGTRGARAGGYGLRERGEDRVRGIVYVGDGKAEVTDELELRAPGPREVIVRMVAAGLCHTDASVLD